MNTKQNTERKMHRLILVVSLFIVLGMSSAYATVIDLTTAGASGTVNGAIFEQTSPDPTGTGVIDSFVQILGNDDVLQAYNTTVNNTFDVGPSNQFNHELLLSAVPVKIVDGVAYRRFLLDINQQNNGDKNLLSLDEIQIFLSSTPNQSVETLTANVVNLANASLVYRLDTPVTDNWIKLDYALNPGSGGGDMWAYIPDSYFTGPAGYDYVYLYSRFGDHFEETGGFEEWSVPGTSDTIVPEPATLSLLGLGIAGMVIRYRRRSR